MNDMSLPKSKEQRIVPRERRLNMRLMAFWWDRRAERIFPSIEDFEPDDMSEVWTNCFTLRLEEPHERSVFCVIGDTIAKESGVTQQGLNLKQVKKNSLLDHATREFEVVLDQKVPVIHSGEFVNDDGDTVMYRSILLPLSTDQTTIDCLVGGARCKVKPSN